MVHTIGTTVRQQSLSDDPLLKTIKTITLPKRVRRARNKIISVFKAQVVREAISPKPSYSWPMALPYRPFLVIFDVMKKNRAELTLSTLGSMSARRTSVLSAMLVSSPARPCNCVLGDLIQKRDRKQNQKQWLAAEGGGGGGIRVCVYL